MTDQEILEHTGLAIGFLLVGPLFIPLWILALIELARVLVLAVRRYRLAQRLTQEQLVDHLRDILRTRPLILYPGKSTPRRPSFILTTLKASAAASTISLVVLLVFINAMRPGEIALDWLLQFQACGQVLAGFWVAMFYPRFWLDWKQSMMLHQAGSMFRLWREELEPLLALRAAKAPLLKGSAKN